MKVVKRQSDGALVYRSEPAFKKGFGIKNAVALFGGKPEDYEEVEMTEEQYNTNPVIVAERVAAENEAKIAAKSRQTAIDDLIAAGELPAGFKTSIA